MAVTGPPAEVLTLLPGVRAQEVVGDPVQELVGDRVCTGQIVPPDHVASGLLLIGLVTHRAAPKDNAGHKLLAERQTGPRSPTLKNVYLIFS